MDKILYIKGTLLVIVSFLIFRFAFLYFKSNQTEKSLLYIVFGGALLRFWCLTDSFLHAWDERYHALVAKNLISNPLTPTLYKNPILPYDHHQWTINHIWLHKQPLSLWLMSLSINVFGNVEWAVRLPSFVLSVACIYLTFLIARFFTNEKTALLTAFLQSINGLIIEIAAGRQSTDHVDTAFLFFIELSIWLTVLYVEKRKNIQILGIGLAMGLAFLTKSFPALIVLPIFLILTMKPKEYIKSLGHCLLIFAIALAVYLPWQMYIFKAFPQEAIWENNYNIRHLTEALEGHAGNVFWQLVYATKIWNELIYIVFLWFVIFVSKRLKDRKLLSLIIWLTIPYLFFSLVATKMIAYPLFTAPAIFIVEALFCWQLLDKPIKPLWLSKFLVITLIVLAARYSYERLKPFDPQTSDREIAATIKSWSPILSKNKQTIVFNAENYIEVMFYHNNCIAYPYFPENKDIEYLNKLGYTIYIIKNSRTDSIPFLNAHIQFLTF